MDTIRTVELFAGVGGFRLGLEAASDRFKVIWANQWEPSMREQYAFECYTTHFGNKKYHVCQDIAKAKIDVPDHDLLVGGFPCQDYSIMKKNSAGIKGTKGALWWQIDDMNYLLARIRDRRNGMRCVLSNQEIYESPNTLDSAVPYAPDDSLEEGEWFYLDNFTQRDYCLDILRSPVNGTAYAAITDDELGIISFLCSVQDDGLVYFQRVTKTQLLRQKRVVFGDSVRFEENSREIVINSAPDAIYRSTDNRLFFQKLSAITAIFHGIDEIFREATDEETNNFLASDFIVVGESYDSSCVKKPNRKRIALAKEALNSYDAEQKTAVLQSIRDYYPSIINDDDSFKIETDDDLTYLLYGVLQRYYTTADGREKRIASSVRSLQQ